MTLTKAKEMLQNAGVNADHLTVKKGVFTIRKSFFYRQGHTATEYAEGLAMKVPSMNVLDKGEVDKPFRGGASIANSSHWWVKFTLPE